MFQTEFVEKIKTKLFKLNNLFFFPWKSCRLLDDVEKYCIDGQATDDNMARVHCMMDT